MADKQVISFTANFERERIDIRFSDNTETRVSYKDIYPKLKMPVKATEKQVNAEIKRRKEAIEALTDIDDKKKAGLVTRLNATSMRDSIVAHVENELSAQAACTQSQKRIKVVLDKMSAAITQVLDSCNDL